MSEEQQLEELISQFRVTPEDRDLWLIIADCCDDLDYWGLGAAWRKVHSEGKWPLRGTSQVPSAHALWVTENDPMPDTSFTSTKIIFTWRPLFLGGPFENWEITVAAYQALKGGNRRGWSSTEYESEEKALLDLVQSYAFYLTNQFIPEEQSHDPSH